MELRLNPSGVVGRADRQPSGRERVSVGIGDDDDLAVEGAGGCRGVDGGQFAERDSLGDVDGELAAVDARDELGQLLGVAADVEVDAAHAALLVAGGGHPHGGADHDAAVADQAGQGGELGGVDRGEVEQDVDRLGDRVPATSVTVWSMTSSAPFAVTSVLLRGLAVAIT